MGVKLRERPGKGWYVLTDCQGQRKSKFFGKNKTLAKQFKEKLEAKLKLGSIGIATKVGVKFEAYAETWLERIRHTLKPSTLVDYQGLLERDLIPSFRGLDLEDVTRDKVKALAFGDLKRGATPRTAQKLVRVVSSLLSHAVEDGLLSVNPGLKSGKFLPKVSKRRGINPFTREEVWHFLETVRERSPSYHPLFLCALRTGVRLGELVALQWGDVDFHGRFLEVQRNYTRGRLTTPKNGESRRVDMSAELTKVLKDLQTERQLQTIANGWPTVPEWVFFSGTGNLLDPDHLRNRVFYPILKASGLRRIRLHDLRHSYASLLLQQGESSVYVKEQMGHFSIQVTVDLYGHLIPGGNRQAVDRLDAPVYKATFESQSANQTQPTQTDEESKVAQVRERLGAPGRI